MYKRNDLLIKNVKTICIISKADTDFRKQILLNASKNTIYCILDITINTLNGNIPMSNNLKQKLSKEKNTLRFIYNKRDKRLSVIRKKLISISKQIALICENFLDSDLYSDLKELCREENWN